MSIVLIGYRGTGKTTVANVLAKRLRWPVVDTDDEIQRRAGKTIAEIFDQEGEERFRDLESAVVRSLANDAEAVISLGGGAILREQNRVAIRGHSAVVWLRATPETVYGRLQTDLSTAQRRPNLTAVGGMPEIRLLLETRSPLYEQCADHCVDTEGKTPQAIADEILRLTELR